MRLTFGDLTDDLKIASRDLTDVALVSEDTDKDKYDEDEDEDESYLVKKVI